MAGPVDPVALKVGWARLLALTDDAAAAVIRGAFSSLVREMHDLAVSVSDGCGRLLTTSQLGSPGLAGTLPTAVRHFAENFPAEDLHPGDVLATNDPWLATGHLNDISIAQPVFRGGRVVAWAACAAHVEDIGGLGPTINAREIYEEGFFIPPCRIVDAGTPNALFFTLLQGAVRTPDSVIGDVKAQIAAVRQLAGKIGDLLDHLGWPDLEAIADDLFDRTMRSTRAAIAKIPDGIYANSCEIDSYRQGVAPLTLRAAVTVAGESLSVDCAGSSPQVAWGINAPLNVTRGYGMFPLKCILDPTTPLNDGFLRSVSLTAPEGSIVNALRPAPVWGRLVVGYFLPELIFGALAQAVPDRVVAGSGGVPMWANFFDGTAPSGGRFISIMTPQGGMGARATKDGPATLAWPGNLAMMPIEVFEHETGLLCEAQELTTDSGGAGRYRGGLGQRLVIAVPDGLGRPEKPVRASLRGARLRFPGPGLAGGEPTPLGRLEVDEEDVTVPHMRELRPGQRVRYHVPGGGGFGQPATRDPAAVVADVRDGYVSAAAARDVYRVVLDDAGDADATATAALRGEPLSSA